MFPLLLGLAALTVLFVTSSSGSTSPQTPSPMPPDPTTPPPPPPGIPVPAKSVQLVRPNHPPLFLVVFQDGASDWTPIGWYYGHLDHVGTQSGTHNVWFTPEYEVRDVLGGLLAQGISGYFDTIEPDGFEDKDFRGRLDAPQSQIWFYDESDSADPHYVASGQHHIEDYLVIG